MASMRELIKEKYPKYEQHYKLALRIIAVFVCVGMALLTIGLSFRSRVIFTAVATGAAILFTLLTRKLSFRFLMIGDGLKKGWQKLIFYLAIPVLSVVVFYLLSNVFSLMFDLGHKDLELAAALSGVFYYLLFELALLIGICVPYVQTILVLILRKFIRVKSY